MNSNNLKPYKIAFFCVMIIAFAWGAGINLDAAKWQKSKWELDIETGGVFPGYNNVRIPNDDSGTRFSLKRALDIEKKVYYRLRLSYRLSHRHSLSLLFAPLSLDATGILPKNINFDGSFFSSGTAVTALYRFNSYRLTYRYLLVDKPKLIFWLGLTAKIRDAEIAIESHIEKASNANVGFVPLLHFYLEWQWSRRTAFVIDADALAAKQGRAEDVSFSFIYRPLDNFDLKFGYRFVEGGADSDTVFTFAMINYLYGGIRFRF